LFRSFAWVRVSSMSGLSSDQQAHIFRMLATTYHHVTIVKRTLTLMSRAKMSGVATSTLVAIPSMTCRESTGMGIGITHDHCVARGLPV
jgi:hypothetical protein